VAINKAQDIVRKTGDLPVPLHLRNAPTRLMKDLGYGKEYKYAHDFNDHFISESYLPEEIEGTVIFDPGETKRENEIRLKLAEMWKDKYKY